jgi:hypothetical protein
MCQAGRKAPKLARRATDTKSAIWPEARKNSSKLNELLGNVYENKGPLWKTWSRSGNVTENKGTYSSKAGILLKTNEL